MKRKDKDVEALWAEVKRLTLEMCRLQQQYDEQTACVIVHRGSALACSDAMLTAYYDERRRAERLREVLAELITWIPSADTYRRLGFDPEAPIRAYEEAKAALSKEATR